MTRLALAAETGRYQRDSPFYQSRANRGTRIFPNRRTAAGSGYGTEIDKSLCRLTLQQTALPAYKPALPFESNRGGGWYPTTDAPEILVGLDQQILVGSTGVIL